MWWYIRPQHKETQQTLQSTRGEFTVDDQVNCVHSLGNTTVRRLAGYMHAKSVTTAAAVTSLCHAPATHLARDLTAANPVQHKNMFVLQWSLHSIIMLH